MLARFHKAMDEREGGFTLIELLVVMIIIGILAAIAIPIFLNQRSKAAETGVKSDAVNVYKDVAAFEVDGPVTAVTPAAVTGTNLWTLTATVNAATETTTVNLGPGNTMKILSVTASTGGTDYCVAVIPPASAPSGTFGWTADQNGIKRASAGGSTWAPATTDCA